MELVYEAANGIEAHMVADLLLQEGIPSRVDGADLQGAVGMLPAAGFVRVMVEPEQHAAARGVIDRWNAAQLSEAPAAPSSSSQARAPARWPAFLAGVAVASAAAFAYMRLPATANGTDYNKDGILDETWTYSPRGLPLKVEADRNLDGKVDLVTRYDDRGIAVETLSDDNFDGVFETRTHHRMGNVVASTSDTDGDGFEDMRTTYASGIISTIEYLEPRTGKPLKTEFYKLGKIVRAEIDTDGDGVMDRRVTYDAIAEPVKTERIQP